jgi:hypothetical protein
MRFLALFRKELRENLPWMLLAGVALLAIGGLNTLGSTVSAKIGMSVGWYAPPGQPYQVQQALTTSDLAYMAPLLLLVSCGLGLLLAGRQFLFPTVLREWPFTLHRSTTRLAVLLAKLSAAGAAFLLGVGLVWSALYLWASQPGVLAHPVQAAVYWEGWLYVLLGMLAYVAAATSSLSRSRWYTTRLFPLALAAIIICLVLTEWSLLALLAVMIVGLAVLGVQLVALMLYREF